MPLPPNSVASIVKLPAPLSAVISPSKYNGPPAGITKRIQSPTCNPCPVNGLTENVLLPVPTLNSELLVICPPIAPVAPVMPCAPVAPAGPVAPVRPTTIKLQASYVPEPTVVEALIVSVVPLKLVITPPIPYA